MDDISTDKKSKRVFAVHNLYYMGYDISIFVKKREVPAEWKAPLFFQAGRNVLIKLDASAILVYNMSVLSLSKRNTTNQIDKGIRKVWWRDQGNTKKFYIIKWSQLCKPISDGELGISDTKINNLAPT